MLLLAVIISRLKAVHDVQLLDSDVHALHRTLRGSLARLLVPGRDPMTWWQTLLLGVLGCYAGGFLAYILFGWDKSSGAIQLGGVFSSIGGAIVLLLIWRAFQRRRTSHPTRPAGTA
jgi:uncharacterized membrane protein YeaQ/YmgE (transglycosylase-associated protein family)